MRKPHDGVFCRLGSSPIHGVGVFAILPILKGTLIFPDEGKFLEVKEEEVSALPAPIKKLYDDFCPLEGGKYVCPLEFNQVDIGYYLNHSKEPNCYTNDVLVDNGFYALRDIAVGEELTVDYDTYSPMIQ
jgi:uncharacterized protein